MKIKHFLLLLLGVVALSGCADVATCVTDQHYGFWNGLWHGAILGFSLIGSLFSDSIAIYAVNNNGAFYDLGFFLGTIGFLAGLVKLAVAVVLSFFKAVFDL